MFDPAAVAALIARVGAHRVAVGTDYPFVILERPAGEALFAAGLPQQVTDSVASTTAAEMLGIFLD